MPVPKPPVAVAVSGGADSLFALLRLHEAGLPVIALHGLFIPPDLRDDAEPPANGATPPASASKASESGGGSDSALRADTADAGGGEARRSGEHMDASPQSAENDPNETRRRLARLCEALGVPLHIVDCSAEFTEAVIRPFVQGYADGATPNPCALCNARIKFGLLQDKARALGAGSLATGHYVRLIHRRESEESALPPQATGHAPMPPQGAAHGSLPPQTAGHAVPPQEDARGSLPLRAADHGPILLQGADPLKDQSYFLALTPLERLAGAVFPLGDERKKDILAALDRLHITPPQPGESQEVCFIPKDEYRDFLPRAAKRLGITLPGPGPMRLADGKSPGRHKGLWQYTEGQRRGLGLGWTEPLHVIAKQIEDNVLLLGPRREMRASGCSCDEVNILLPPAFWPDAVMVKTRYRERPKAARASLSESASGLRLRIELLEPDTAIAPGQIAAVYIPFRPAPEQDGPQRDSAEQRGEEGKTGGSAQEPFHNKAAFPDGEDGSTLRLVAGGIITESW